MKLNLEADGFYVGSGIRDDTSRLYTFPEPVSQVICKQALISTETNRTQLWHKPLAHINGRDLMNVHKYADGVPKLAKLEEICRACRLGKAHKLPFSGQFKRTENVGELVHSDIMGKLEPSFPDNFRYIATFLDDHSRYLLLACMKKRDDLHGVYSQISSQFRRLAGAPETTEFNFSKLHSDGAKENIALQKNLGGDNDNDNSVAPPYTPELNGVAERVNRTIVEAALALLIQANLSRCLWSFAVKHVAYVRNRVPHSTIGTTPFSVLTGTKPSLKNVRVFGCTAYVLRLPQKAEFESRAVEGVYLETLKHGVYRVLITDEDDIPRIIESRHVTFDESKFLGSNMLEQYMDDEVPSDDDYFTDANSESSDSGSESNLIVGTATPN